MLIFSMYKGSDSLSRMFDLLPGTLGSRFGCASLSREFLDIPRCEAGALIFFCKV